MMDETRLTVKGWRNLDPWECCGQDDFCKRGCHEAGGCTKGCIVPALYVKLAKLEDAAELARQVPDGEIQAAIDYAHDGYLWASDKEESAIFQTFEAALRQYRKPEPCEWISYSGEDPWGRKYRYFRCPDCRKKTAIKSNYCSNCGRKIGDDRT